MSDPGKAVFLSYASQDAEAAKRICDELRGAGVEVWFDAEGGLEHGDEWDAKIRRQIKECVLFLPIISANTQAREEGYFRIEWELAAQRALGIASGVAFILPIVIDDTKEPDALVPDRFRSVQWTRLRDGQLTPEVKARFLKLWSHRAGVVKHLSAAANVGASLDDARGRGQAAPLQGVLPKPGWKTYAGMAAAIFALVALVGWWMLRPATPIPASPVPGPTVASGIAAAPVSSEARLLVDKARALLEALDSVRDDFKLAEELITQAKAKDAADAEVWAAEAQLHHRYFLRGWDTSDARREAARVASQRALRLDPNSFEVRFAQAGQLDYAGRDGAEKERLLRLLRQERPSDHRVLRDLGRTLDRLGRKDEGITFYEEAAALPGGDPLALYDKSLALWFAGRTVEAEAAIQACLAQKSFTSALLVSGWYAMVLRGDLTGARAILDRVPPAELLEDRGCFFSFYQHLLAHEPDAALAGLRAVPRDWLNDNWYRGPKGRLAGDALLLAGRPEAAAVEWRAALKLVDARLATSPSNRALQTNRIRLLARLGERPAAEQQFSVLLQMEGLDPAGSAPVPAWLTDICIELGRKADAIRQISLGLKQERRAVDYTAAILRLDPTYDPLRTEPGFAELITEAERIEQAAAVAATPARDWPKNPELKKAIALLDGLQAIPEDIRLAEEMVQPLLEKSPTDPEVVTAMARVHSMWLLRGWDRSNARYQKAKSVGERALQLAPNEPEALNAMAIYLYARGVENQRALDLAQQAVDLAPSVPRFHRQRDNCLFVLSLSAAEPTDQPLLPKNAALDRAIASFRRTTELFPQDPLVHYELARRYRDLGRWAEFEKETDVALALAPVANAITWKARARFGLHGDLAGMKALLDQVPARVRTIERTVFSYFLYSVYTGDTSVGLEALNSLTDGWMIDFDYVGPKALPLAGLLEIDGKKELARLQYEAALAELQRSRVTNPTSTQSFLVEAWIQHGLGHREEARTALRVFNESIARPFTVSPIGTWWFQPIAANLLMGEREPALALIREACGNSPEGRGTIRSRLALDRRMAPFRDDPEILAILNGPGAPVASSTATTATGVAPAVPATAELRDPELKRAIKLIESSEAIASDVALAEDLVKGVLAAHPTDPAATVAMGRVQVYSLVRGFDRSEDRFATAKRFAERGLALAPDDPDAMMVMATYLYRRGVELPRATKLLRAAIALRPTEPLYYRMLDNVLSITPDVTDAEIIASAKVTAERFPSDVLVQYELARHYRDAGMLEEAEHYFDIAIKLGPVANAIIARARLMLFAHGDPAGMKTLLDQLPERFRGTDRAVFSQFAYALVTGQPGLGLEALQALPEPWMIDFDYTGPTALLAGELLLQQGKAELARMKFTDALAELGRHKADFSRNFSTTWLETWLLMRLGRLDEARKRNEIYFPELPRPYRIYLGTNWWFNPINQCLLLGERAKALALMREAVGFQQGRTILRNAFRLDPRMAPFRDDPEIKALLAEPVAAGSVAPIPTSPALTPARDLARKALALVQGLDATREDFALAEDYCQRALKLDTTDGEVWAAYAQLNAAFGYRGWDSSPERREQNRVMAERAIRLAPDSVQAKLAQAGAWTTFNINRPETEKLLREVVAQEPDNQPALRFLAVTMLNQGKLDECLALNERSAALPGGDPLALFNSARYLWQRGRPAEAYAIMQRSLAQKPFSSSLMLKTNMEITWRGDLEAAEATLQQIPQSALLEDRANYTAGLLRFYQRRSDLALATWGSFPRDYYSDFAYDGPKGLLIGLADELDHRDAAAKIEWRTALQLVEKRIAATPTKPAPYYYQAYLLACLGDKAAAGEALRTCEQLSGIKYTPGSEMTYEMALIYVRLGRLDEFFAQSHRVLGRGKVDPRMDALRADPRYAKLLAEHERQKPEAAKK